MTEIRRIGQNGGADGAGRAPTCRELPALGFLDLHHLTAHVVATVGTHDMCRNTGAAFRANGQLAGAPSVMRSTFSGP